MTFAFCEEGVSKKTETLFKKSTFERKYAAKGMGP